MNIFSRTDLRPKY